MSFSSEIKKKAVAVPCESNACRLAELSGAARFGAHIAAGGISFYTEHEFICRRIANDLQEAFGITPDTAQTQRAYKIRISADKSTEVSTALLLDTTDFERLTDELIPDDDTCAAFIRGAFLNGGSVADPAKSYHLEFNSPHEAEAEFLLKLLGSYGYYSKIAARKNGYVVYMKECDAIAEILGLIGAGAGALELYNMQAERELRNSINRRVNCETANQKKTATAALKQIRAIRRIIDAGEFYNMPEILRETAQMRLDNPDMSLSELGAALSVGRSGINHRMERIMRIAEEL